MPDTWGEIVGNGPRGSQCNPKEYWGPLWQYLKSYGYILGSTQIVLETCSVHSSPRSSERFHWLNEDEKSLRKASSQ
jgi:hypothetical protein